MSFAGPENLSITERDVLETALKRKVIEWKDSSPYYAVGKENLDSTAKNYFQLVKNSINRNKDALKDAGFKGNFTFKIAHENSGQVLDSFDMEF